MRHLLLFAGLILSTTGACAQNNFRQGKPNTTSLPNASWDLNKFVWSHTHTVPSKNNKPLLDFKAIENWMIIGPESDFSISPDGKYVAYTIQNAMYRTRDTLIIQSTKDSWRQSYKIDWFTDETPGFFSDDGTQYIFQNKENLFFLRTGSSEPRIVKGVVSYQQPSSNKGEWLAYQLKDKESTLILHHLLTGKENHYDNVSSYSFDPSGSLLVFQLNNATSELVLYNLINEKEQRFPSVVKYSFDASGKVLVLKTNKKDNTVFYTSLQYISLPEASMHTFWSTTDTSVDIKDFSIDRSGKQVVFAVQQAPPLSNLPNSSIWYYRIGMDKAVLKVNDQTTGIDANLHIQGVPTFTWIDGRYIQFSLQSRPETPKQPNLDISRMDLFSYSDRIIQPTQNYFLKQPERTYTAIIDPQGDRVIRLDHEYEKFMAGWPHSRGDFAIVGKRGREANGDRFWEQDYYKDSIWLVSLKDGNRILLKTNQLHSYWFSPDGNYLVYFDADKQGNYFSINLTNRKLVQITAGIPAWQLGASKSPNALQPLENNRIGIAAWLEHDAGLLVYDKYYDIWQLDLAGKKPPVNITNGYARRYHTRLILPGYKNDYDGSPMLALKDTLILAAFNTQSKQTGLYRKLLGKTGDPEKLYLGACQLVPLLTSSDWTKGIYHKPLKATGSNIWIVKRQRADEAPNYLLTYDFVKYQPLTDVQPQKQYNWLTAELHSFKQLDGTISQGILYKPENFDPTKKYPLIIAFYTTLTDNLHKYPVPSYISSPSTPIESPGWLVSHGYLVFTPDIYFKKEQWGPSTLNTIDGAAKYLSTLPYVDSRRLAACGHSNSGRYAAYVLTHSKSFAAMSIGEGYGFANVINTSLSFFMNDKSASLLGWSEVGDNGFASELGNLWHNKKSWLDHTAILQADKVNSPLLMFCRFKEIKTNGGGDNKIEQSIQLFTALRRLEKKVWWVGYNEASHVIILLKDLKDFTIRYTQFFDHYLKGAPAPRWMSEGIPANLKGIESRYELDSKGSCSLTCSVCKAKNTNKTGK